MSKYFLSSLSCHFHSGCTHLNRVHTILLSRGHIKAHLHKRHLSIIILMELQCHFILASCALWHIAQWDFKYWLFPNVKGKKLPCKRVTAFFKEEKHIVTIHSYSSSRWSENSTLLLAMPSRLQFRIPTPQRIPIIQYSFTSKLYCPPVPSFHTQVFFSQVQMIVGLEEIWELVKFLQERGT